MFNWLKPKPKKTAPLPSSSGMAAPTGAGKSREDIIREAQSNVRNARAAIGVENLERLAGLLQQQQHQQQADAAVSPAVQARKILEHMDKGHIADFLRALDKDNKPTKH